MAGWFYFLLGTRAGCSLQLLGAAVFFSFGSDTKDA
jgi:hypothetical protein